MGAGKELKSNRATDQNMVPEPKDEVEEELTASGSKPGGQLKFWIRGWRSSTSSGSLHGGVKG